MWRRARMYAWRQCSVSDGHAPVAAVTIVFLVAGGHWSLPSSFYPEWSRNFGALRSVADSLGSATTGTSESL